MLAIFRKSLMKISRTLDVSVNNQLAHKQQQQQGEVKELNSHQASPAIICSGFIIITKRLLPRLLLVKFYFNRHSQREYVM